MRAQWDTPGVQIIAVRRLAEILSSRYRKHGTGGVQHAITCSTFGLNRPAATGSAPCRALSDVSARCER